MRISVKIVIFSVIVLLMGNQFAYAAGCPDGLWRERHSVLWDGNTRWDGEWTRNGCSNEWTVVWECVVCRREDTQTVTMIRSGDAISITTPNCRYSGNYSPYSEFVTGSHACGSSGGTFTSYPGPSLKKRSKLR